MESLRQYKQARVTVSEQVARSREGQGDVSKGVRKSQNNLEKHLSKDLQDEQENNIERKQGKLVVKSGDKESGDASDAHNWPMWRRTQASAVLFFLVLMLGWGSSSESDSSKPAALGYHVSQVAETVSTALFMIGIATGALFVGPLSETVGRNPTYLVFTLLYLCFTLGSALSPNYGAQLAFRFLSGLTSSPALSVYGGSLSDLWTKEERRRVWPIWGLSPVLGPILSQVASGWFERKGIDWRWDYWVSLIFGGVAWVIALFFMPETHSATLLDWKAKHLRDVTKDDRYVSPKALEKPFVERLQESLKFPITFFTTEPIIIFFGLYLVIIYIINFTFLSGFEFIFSDTYGLNSGITSLAFIGITIGAILSTLTYPIFIILQKKLAQRKQDNNDKADEDAPSTCDQESTGESDDEPSGPPELGLLQTMFAAPLLAISVFWLGWTNWPSISPLSGYGATVLFGYALTAIFTTSYQYIIDSYEARSSTALGSITAVRYFASGGMIVASRPMYQGLTVHWTLTLLGCLAVVMVPVPFVLFRFGDRIRRKSKFAR